LSDTLAFHAADPGGEEGFVVLLHRPEGGSVRTTEWPAGAYLAPATQQECPVDDLLARVRGWRSRGWQLSEPVERIESWLKHPPR
jgi:hypothetical protein